MADFDAEEIRAGHADDGKWTAVEHDGAPNDVRVGGEFAIPECVTDDCAGRAAAEAVVIGGEEAAEQRLDAEHAEEIAADVQSLGVTSFAAGREVETRGAPGEGPGEGLLAVANLLPLAVCEAGAPGGKPSRAHRAFAKIDVGQFLGPLHWKRAKPHGVHELEDG